MICKSLFCNREIIDEHGSREYCNNNNRCKNKHHAAIKKQELLRYREEESFKLRREVAINKLRILCKDRKVIEIPFTEFEMMSLDLTEPFFKQPRAESERIFYNFFFEEFKLRYSVMSEMIRIVRYKKMYV